ncbi:MAG TPA: TrkA C-terminal domain-containing protein [Dermatophilaceae bacterium]|nr:TrkA C-terminal domain-containing protein [Dermatophilaceae bacterium]
MDFTETMLPGVGIRYEARTRDGKVLGIVVAHDGGAEVVTYRRDDPDAVATQLRLEPEEALAIAELLGAPRLSSRLADLSREVPGLSSARFTVTAGSRYDGRRLGDSKARTRTGCSIVAVVRGDQVYAAPGPRARLRADDVVVAIGSTAGLAELAHIFAMSPDDDPYPIPVDTLDDELGELDDVTDPGDAGEGQRG